MYANGGDAGRVFAMTKAEIESLIEKAKAATQDSAQWNTEEPASNEWKNNKINNAAFIRVANPEAIQTLAQNYLAALEVIKFYRGSDDDETSWMEPDQHLMYWTLWNDGACVGGKVADDFLKKVGCE